MIKHFLLLADAMQNWHPPEYSFDTRTLNYGIFSESTREEG
jgi:hypothetical protein